MRALSLVLLAALSPAAAQTLSRPSAAPARGAGSFPFASPSAAPAPSETQREAAALRRRLDELSALVTERLDREVLETAGLATQSAKKTLFKIRDEQRAALLPIELEAAFLAEQLQRYRDTGVLSPTPAATVDRIRRQLTDPWSRIVVDPTSHLTPAPEFSLDLEVLQRQLAAWHPQPRAPRIVRAPETLPAALSPRAAARGVVPAPSLARDAGAGKRAHDAVPVLIEQLSSSEPRERALAADLLGSSGPVAARAVPALRRALSDPDRRVRSSAVLALGSVGEGSAAVLADARALLLDRDVEVRLSAGIAVSRLSAPR
jgi:hypothetical protein